VLGKRRPFGSGAWGRCAPIFGGVFDLLAGPDDGFVMREKGAVAGFPILASNPGFGRIRLD